MEVEQAAAEPVLVPSAAQEVAKANDKIADKPSGNKSLGFINESQAKEPAPQEEKPKVAKAKPEGWDKVDFKNDSPEKIEKRFGRMYKQVHELKRDVQTRDDVLKQQSEVIAELYKGQSQVVNHLQNQDFVAAESTLKQQRKEARANGDEDRVDEINDRLREIGLKKIAAGQQKQAQPQQQAQQQRPQNAAEAARYAVSQGALPSEEADAIEAWQEETDTAGEPLRPWSQASDPDYVSALAVARSIFTNPLYAKKTIEEKLSMVDKRMGVDRPEPRQNVMPGGNGAGGNLTRQNGRGNMRGVQMSERTERLAVQTKFAGPGKSAQDHIDAYRAQISKVRGA